jgi:hypothetical protein
MPEPLTSSLLLELIAKLHVAFPRTIGEKNPAMMADVYRNGLRGLSGDAVRHAVDRCIETEEYFPKVSKLREMAKAWDVQRTVTLRFETSWDVCPACGARATWTDCYRSTGEKGPDGKLLLDEAGRPLRVYSATRLHIAHDRRAHGVPMQREEEQSA